MSLLRSDSNALTSAVTHNPRFCVEWPSIRNEAVSWIFRLCAGCVCRSHVRSTWLRPARSHEECVQIWLSSPPRFSQNSRLKKHHLPPFTSIHLSECNRVTATELFQKLLCEQSAATPSFFVAPTYFLHVGVVFFVGNKNIKNLQRLRRRFRKRAT